MACKRIAGSRYPYSAYEGKACSCYSDSAYKGKVLHRKMGRRQDTCRYTGKKRYRLHIKGNGKG